MSPDRRNGLVHTSPTRRALSWTAVLAAAVMASVSCSNLVDGRAVVGAPPVGTPIGWGQCESSPSDVVPIPPSAECGTLSVPVDYAKPDGDIAQIALIRFPATGSKIGSLVVNPGGPGESGITAATGLAQDLPEELGQRFDLVGFDPRGVSASTPAVWCNSDEDNDRQRADPTVEYTKEGVEHINGETKAFVQRCVDKMGKDFLANVGTASVAKDLDALRAALGDAKLTYLGYSYGTRIGSAYAEAYPQNVRAMILDGAVDPNADPIEASIRQSAAFQKAFDDYAVDCAVVPSCPLGTDPTKAVAVYKSLTNRLVANPAPTADPRGLGYSDAIVGTIMTLYSPTYWQLLTQGLTELAAGRGDTMLKLSDLYMGRDEQGRYNNSTDLRVAVNCVDQPAVTDPAKVVEQDRRSREVAPFMNYGAFTGMAPMSVCGFWPVEPTSTPHQISAKGLPPVLVVSTTNDPATPYQAGVDLAKQLNGTLVTFDGTQHTVVLQGDTCIDDIATKYLVDLTLPPPNTTC